MSAVLTASVPVHAPPPPLRVMVVDDSVVMRGILGRWLKQETDFELVASLCTGREAVDQFDDINPDVVILDIEMPELDGLAALPLLLAKKRDLAVIMASSLTRRHAEVSLRALSLGAADYVPKPSTSRGIGTSEDFRRELVEKVRQLGRNYLRGRLPRGPRPAAESARGTGRDEATSPPLRTAIATAPQVLAIGASTGGPQALTELFAQLGPVTDRAPILIVQHMPPTFTTIFADHLTRVGGRPVHEAEDGELVVAGKTYLAPGGRHMLVERRNGRPAIRLHDGAPVHFCKPAVDPLFVSVSRMWGRGTVAVILTGMGRDGTQGARAVAAAGGSVIAQDEASSVIWGMPGSAARAGLCSAVLPLDDIAPKLVRAFAGEQP